MGSKNHFVVVPRGDIDLQISMICVKSRKYRLVALPVDTIVHAPYRVRVLYHENAQFSVFHTDAKRSILSFGGALLVTSIHFGNLQ